MRAVAAIIGLLGIGNVLAPLGCIGGCTLTEGSLDALALVGGLCLLSVAYGIWQRLLWAWRFLGRYPRCLGSQFGLDVLVAPKPRLVRS